MRKVFRILILLAIVALSIAGAAGTASAATGSISGVIRESDGKTPINGGRITVYLNDSEAAHVNAQADGSYSIGGLAAGSYNVKAYYTGYETAWYSKPVTVVDGQDTKGVDFALKRGITLSGKVVNQVDWIEPLPNIRVEAQNVRTGAVYSAYSNDTGRYSIVVPSGGGTYIMCAEGHGFKNLGWKLEYYDNTPSAGAATRLNVTSSRENIIFSLSPSACIAGSVFEADGATPVATAQIRARQSAGTTDVAYGHSGASNGLYYVNLPQGYNYKIYATAPGYLTQWWENATTQAASQEIPLLTLLENPGHNFRMLSAVQTAEASSVTATSATLNGELKAMCGSASVDVSFEYGLTTAYGQKTTPSSLEAAGPCSANVTGLLPSTTYHYRALAAGTSPKWSNDSDNDLTFTTGAAPPSQNAHDSTTPVQTNPGPSCSQIQSSENSSTAMTITWSTDRPATGQVEYGLTDAYGEQSEAEASLDTSHSVTITGLETGQTYHYRVISKDVSNNQTVSDDNTFSLAAGSSGMPAWGWALIGLAVVAAGGGAIFFLAARKRSTP